MNRCYHMFVALTVALVVFGVATNVVEAGVLHVPADFATIQDAVDAAAPGDTIQVAPGVYEENVLILKSDIRLHAPTGLAVLDGTDIGGFGFHVLGLPLDPVEDVAIQGFIVDAYERGIVLEDADFCEVKLNEVSNNRDRDSSDGAFNLADGIVLIDAAFNDVRNNDVHDNGHNGIFLLGTMGNTIKGNDIFDNGLDTGAAVAGCGIQLGGAMPNVGNDIEVNDIRRAAWGILLGPGGEGTDNFIARNKVHENRRAGIAILGTAHADNVIQQNNATGNALLNLPPSGTFDLFEDGTINNTWKKNKGTSNF